MSERRTVTVALQRGAVVLEYWPEHGCWYEASHADEVGALYAPAFEDGHLPTDEDVCEVSVRYADA